MKGRGVREFFERRGREGFAESAKEVKREKNSRKNKNKNKIKKIEKQIKKATVIYKTLSRLPPA
jgi:hypothetical protein